MQNDYFHRPLDPGRLVLKMDGAIRDDLIQHLSLYDGVATLTVSLPDGSTEGESHVFSTEIVDDCIIDSFENEFYVSVMKEEGPRGGKPGERHKPVDPKKKGSEYYPNGSRNA